LHVEVYRIVNVLALKFFIVTNISVEYKYRADYHTIKLDISLGPHHFRIFRVRVRVMVFNATFNNISVISWWSVLLVEKTRVLGEDYHTIKLDISLGPHHFVEDAL
jgi:hypothetical protein